MQFEIHTGKVEWGWSEFAVRLGEGRWSCMASYLGHHPLHPLIHSAVDLYHHIFEAPLPDENAVWDSQATDEPGGIVIRAVPQAENVRVTVFLLPDEYSITDTTSVGEGLVDYWSYAGAIQADAARAIVRHGITGFRFGWVPGRWDIDSHFQVFPVEHFLYLSALVKYRSPKQEMSLTEELALLSHLREEYGG